MSLWKGLRGVLFVALASVGAMDVAARVSAWIAYPIGALFVRLMRPEADTLEVGLILGWFAGSLHVLLLVGWAWLLVDAIAETARRCPSETDADVDDPESTDPDAGEQQARPGQIRWSVIDGGTAAEAPECVHP